MKADFSKRENFPQRSRKKQEKKIAEIITYCGVRITHYELRYRSFPNQRLAVPMIMQSPETMMETTSAMERMR